MSTSTCASSRSTWAGVIAGIAMTAVVSATISGATAATPLSIGKPAPEFSAVDSSGKTVKLSDLKGKTVVLEWSNHDCPYVVKHYESGNMQALQKEAARDGAVWLTIVSSAPGEQGHVSGKRADELTRSRGAAPTSVLLDPDGEVGRMYEARTTPHMFVIDKAGLLQYMGGIDDKPTSRKADVPDAKPYVRLALQSLARGEKIAEPVTKPYGCSVKYK